MIELEYLIVTIRSTVLIFFVVWFIFKLTNQHLNAFIELKKQAMKEKIELYRLRQAGEMQRDGIDLSQAIEKSLSVTGYLENNLKKIEKQSIDTGNEEKKIEKNEKENNKRD